MNDFRSQLIQLVAEHKRSGGSAISSITPQRLGQQLAAFRIGTLRDFALTAQTIEERDDTLAGVIPKAKAAVARHGFEVCVLERVPSGMDAMADRQKEALEHFYNNVRATSAMEPDEVGGFSLLVRQIMDAKGKKYANHHIVWKPDRTGGLYTAQLIHTPLWFFENRTGPMRFISSPHGYDGVPMDPGAWLVSVGDGIMRACAAVWIFKRGGLHAWVGFCEKHGFPLVLGKTPAAKGSPEWDAMAEAVESIGEDWSGVINQAATIELIEAKGGATIPYPPLVDRMDRALSRLWRGNDLGTMSREGASVGSNPQEGETDKFDLDAAVWVSETLNHKLDRLVIDYTFGEDVPALAYVKVKGAPKKETELDLKVDEFLLRNGHRISVAQAAERYARPLPKPGETDLLTAPAAPAMSPFGGQPGAPGHPAGNPATAMAQAARALNEVAGTLADAAFRDNARREITEAKRKAFAGLVARFEAAMALTDKAAQDAALASIRADIPRYAKEAGVTEAEVAAWANSMAAKMASGLAEAAKAKAAKPPQN